MNPRWRTLKFDVMAAVAFVIAVFILILVLFGPHR
jgi:hypothetical protein